MGRSASGAVRWVGRRIASARRRRSAMIEREGHLLDSARRRPPAADARPEDPPIDLNALVAPVRRRGHRRPRRRGRRPAPPRHRPGAPPRPPPAPARRPDPRAPTARASTPCSTPTSTRSTRSPASSTSCRPARRVLEAAGRRAIQRVGLVRFNPFEDTGGNQSFALALTDATGNGFVVSSLHSRTGTRVYAKAITGGRSDGALSDGGDGGPPTRAGGARRRHPTRRADPRSGRRAGLTG